MTNNSIAIMVATHKNYDFPQDDGYLPLHVGAAIASEKMPFTRDDSGDNISALNNYFCELTGLYWLWKNCTADIYGVSHYRRYFKADFAGVLVHGNKVASSNELCDALNDMDIVLVRPRNYWIETVYSHYKHAHHIADLDVVRRVLQVQCNDYVPYWDMVMSRRKLSLYNMFVMRSNMFNLYCEWLFRALFEVQEHVSYEEYGPYQSRVFGFLGERMLNVWVEKNIPASRRKYISVVNLDGENIVSKFVNMLRRRFLGDKQS